MRATVYGGQHHVRARPAAVRLLVRVQPSLLYTLGKARGMRKRPYKMQQSTLVMWLGLTWRLILTFLVCPAMGQASASATSSSTFMRAITDPTVSLILIPPDNFELIPEEWAIFNRTNPYVLERNLTIRSSAPPELGQMDFRFLMRKVLLAKGITLTMDYLVLRNINKLGGFGVDFFMGDLDSVISVTRSVRVKFVCPPPEQSLQAAKAFSSPLGAAPNNVDIVDGVCILQNKSTKQDAQNRKCYDDAIKFYQFTLQVGSADPDTGTSQPGYRLEMQNVTRVCDYYVTAECIHQYTEDLCTADLLSRLLSPPAASDGTWQPQTIAGVVAGGVVGFLAVCSLVWFLLWKHRNWWANGNGHSGKNSDYDEQPDTLADDDATRQMNQSLLPPGAGGRMMDPSQAVKLGVLLGSGSFGRVYKGRWHGMDVAVKIMDPCTPDTLPRVLKEAEVMMGLNHQNVVKAYQCSVWSKKQQEQLMKAAESRKASGARKASDGSSPLQAAQRRQLAAAARHSSGSASLPSNSTTASQGVSSSSMAGSLHSPAATGASAGASAEGVVINIIPEFVPRNRSGHSAGAPAFAGGASTSTSSTAAGTRSSHILGAHSSGEAPGLFASAARLWKRQQHEHPDHSSQGPPTGSTSFELQPRTAVTPLSSAAYTLSGSSSVGTVPAGLSAHTSLGVLSSTHDPHPHGVASPASASMSQCTRSSGSVSQGTASDALSSQGVLNVSDGAQGSSLSAAAGQQEIQPAPLEPGKPVMGWLRRPSKRASLEAPDVAPGSDSSSSRAPGSPSAVGSSRSGEKDRDEMQVWLVLELCTGGSLEDAVSCGRIRTSSCQELAKLLSRLLDAATGLAYLHKHGVIHGDLKAANVLLQHCLQGSYGQVAKVSDFGVSAQLLDGATHRSTTSLGTITHMAPEVLRSGRLSKAADVYAYGIMMWEVFTNQTAHAGCHSGAVVERVVLRGERPPVPSGMPPQYALLMQRCWDDDPAQRPSFEQIITCIELLLDNLTSSESEEGRISEGVEEERTSSDSVSVAADKAAATEVAAAAASTSAAAAGTPSKWLEQAPDTPAADPRRGEAATAVSANSSAAGRLWRLIAKGGGSSGAVVDGQSSGNGKGLAESVEGSSDWLSGPGTPGFSIRIEQLRGLKQWCLANGVAPEGDEEPGCVGAPGDIEAPYEAQSGGGTQPTPGWRSGRLQPWLDQCVDALSPPVPKVGGVADKQPWPYSRRWLLRGASKLRGLAVGQVSNSGSSLLSQQPHTPHRSAEGVL